MPDVKHDHGIALTLVRDKVLRWLLAIPLHVRDNRITRFLNAVGKERTI